MLSLKAYLEVKNKMIKEWEQSWKYIHSQRQQQKMFESTIKETSFGGYSTHGQNENYGKVDLPIVISLEVVSTSDVT